MAFTYGPLLCFSQTTCGITLVWYLAVVFSNWARELAFQVFAPPKWAQAT